MFKLEENIIQNIANNYVCIYKVHEIREDLVEILRTKGNNSYYLFKAVCGKVGRIKEEENYFVAETAYERLLKDITWHHSITVLERKKYPGNDNFFVTFRVYK